MPKANILYITDALTPPLYGRRTRFFCHQLHNDGYNVHLVTERYKPLPFNDNYRTTEIPYYRHSSGVMFRAEWAIKNTLTLLFDYRNRYFARKIAELAVAERPDAIVCSTFNSMGLRAAARLSERMGIPFVADLRDIVEQTDSGRYERWSGTDFFSRRILALFRRQNVARRNRDLHHAAAITAVSPWTVEFLGRINPGTHLIYNGYDNSVFQFAEARTDKFRITYAGKWYGAAMQNPTPLFEALGMLRHDYAGVYADIAVEWYTQDECVATLRELAGRYDAGDIQHFNGYVAFEQMPDILHRSSLVLILTDQSSRHVLPTKLFEAIGVEKPVVCVSCTPGALADTIAQTNAGLATTDARAVMQFIVEKHAEWQRNGFTRQLPTGKSSFYSRNHQYSLMKKIIDNVIENNKKQSE